MVVEKRQAEGGRIIARKLAFHSLRLFHQAHALDRGNVFECESLMNMSDDQGVEIITAEAGVAMGGKHLENALLHLKNREVEGAAAEIVNRNS